jgi:hypothetical protein
MEFLPLFETAALSVQLPRELTPRAIVLSLHAIKSNFWRKRPRISFGAPPYPLLRDINGLEKRAHVLRHGAKSKYCIFRMT